MADTILLVDDSRVLRSIVKVVLLRGLGCTLREASDGAQALALLEKTPVDLVVADIDMPILDGISFVKKLRASARPELARTPVVLLTADALREREGLGAGADAFVRKIDVRSGDALLDAVKGLLSKRAQE